MHTKFIQMYSTLTQQYDGTEEDSNQRSSAEAMRSGQGISIAQLHLSITVTAADSHSESPSAALHWVVTICDHYGNQVDALLETAVGCSTCQDAGSVIWIGGSSVKFLKSQVE